MNSVVQRIGFCGPFAANFLSFAEILKSEKRREVVRFSGLFFDRFYNRFRSLKDGAYHRP
jgi:hypothetical protein